ncbi:MAG: hypothetical protein M1127_02110 [Patescibacteria group bacterium]|nr:hypothetical protein [Patescibacteria group bacterium]
MKYFEKIAQFVLAFSGLFYFIRITGHYYDKKIVLADLGGVPWLYAALGTLFAVLAGFVIQKEWENWNNLQDSVKGEVGALRELFLWSTHFPEAVRTRFKQAISDYLRVMSSGGLWQSEQRKKSQAIEQSLCDLREGIFEIFQAHNQFMPTTFSTFSKLLENRENRLRYGSHHTPKSIKNFIFAGVLLLSLLSFFIGIKNMYLAYVFDLSVALMAFILYLIANDLDNPLLPGSWHLTAADYQDLFEEISSGTC